MNSYPERRRDWPEEASATDFKSTVPIPASGSLKDKKSVGNIGVLKPSSYFRRGF